jgi:hypothetical protein
MNLLRSDDGGATFAALAGLYEIPRFRALLGGDPTWKVPPYQISDARMRYTNFITPFVLDPNDTNRLLVGGAYLWRTNDAKAPVTIFSGPQWSNIKGLSKNRMFISTITVAPGNSDIIWVGHNEGDIYYTGHGTAEKPDWRQVAESALPDRYCRSITFHPTDHKIVYVTFGRFFRDNVWKTTDGGQSWQSLGIGTLPEAGAHSLTVHPKLPEFVYVGTEVGLYVSEDAGATWSPANQGPVNCCVEGLFWMGDRLVAATYGRGLYSIDVKL